MHYRMRTAGTSVGVHGKLAAMNMAEYRDDITTQNARRSPQEVVSRAVLPQEDRFVGGDHRQGNRAGKRAIWTRSRRRPRSPSPSAARAAGVTRSKLADLSGRITVRSLQARPQLAVQLVAAVFVQCASLVTGVSAVLRLLTDSLRRSRSSKWYSVGMIARFTSGGSASSRKPQWHTRCSGTGCVVPSQYRALRAG